MWRQAVVQNWICDGKYTVYDSNYDKSGDSKTFVATIVANVATERMLLDTTALNVQALARSRLIRGSAFTRIKQIKINGFRSLRNSFRDVLC
jgi:hypothetical protein